MRVPPFKKPYGSAIGRINFIDNKYIKGKTVVDIGSGTGWFGIYAQKTKVKKIYLIEPSDEANLIAKKYLSNKNAAVIKGNAFPLPIKDNSIDTVVCWEVIEHIPKNTELNLFSEVKRVLKNNGHFFISTPYDNMLSKITDPAWWLIGHRHYSLDDLEAFSKRSGLKLVDSKIQGGIFSILYNLDMYFSKWIFRRSPIFRNFFQPRSSKEYMSNNGYLTLFAHFTKNKI